MQLNKCKICRRNGTKLFLKGDKCLSPKCIFIKKPYAPGPAKKRRSKSLSEYGKELREKQKLRNWYNLRERQFEKYVSEVLEKRGQIEDAAALLIEKLESRLDNVVFRLGFASSHSQARQATTHGHFTINGRKVDVPSYHLKKGDVIALSEKSKKKPLYQNISNTLKKQKTPSWLELNVEKMEGKVAGKPSLDEVSPSAEISSIFEFYSR
jgi:small subunit ribosomal protein S4